MIRTHRRWWLFYFVGALTLAACGAGGTHSPQDGGDSNPADAASGQLQASLTADRTSGVAVGDGDSDGATLTLTVKDAQGQPLPGLSVTFQTTQDGSTVSSAPNTDADGTTHARLRSTTAGTTSVTASVLVDGVSQPLAPSVMVTFAAGTADSTSCTLAVDKYDALSDGVDSIHFTVTVRDRYHNPIQGSTVSLQSDGNWNSLSSSSTDENGVVVLDFSSTEPGQKQVSVRIDGQDTLSAIVHFNPAAASASQSTLSTGQSDVSANGTAVFGIAAVIKDADGRAIAGTRVTLSVTGSGNILTPTSGDTDHDGIFSATLSSTTVEDKTITATVGDVTLAPLTVSFVAGPPDADHSSIYLGPETITVGTDTTLHVLLLDDHDHPAGGINVTTTADPEDAVHIVNASGYTDESGVFSTDATGLKPGNITLHVGAGGLSRDLRLTVQ